MSRQKREKSISSDVPHYARFGTPPEAATWRAGRLAATWPKTIIDVGAGAGFQTAAFAKVAERVIAVDIDLERLKHGSFAKNVVIVPGDALNEEIMEKVKSLILPPCAIFLDPERPPASSERKLADIQPNIKEFIKKYSEMSEDIAIELPPFLDDIPLDCEREYLSLNGALNRLTIYLGGLKRCEVSVVALPEKEQLDVKLGTTPRTTITTVTHPRFLVEPNPALVRAGVVAEALAQAGIAAAKPLDLGNKEVFLTEKSPKNAFFRSYEIVAKNDTAALKAFGRVILHGKLSQSEQGALLNKLSKECRGSGDAHLFLGKEQYLTRIASGR